MVQKIYKMVKKYLSLESQIPEKDTPVMACKIYQDLPSKQLKSIKKELEEKFQSNGYIHQQKSEPLLEKNKVYKTILFYKDERSKQSDYCKLSYSKELSKKPLAP